MIRRAWTLALPVAAVVACAKDTVVTTRTVTTYAPACAPLASPFALLYAYGDFEPAASVPSLPLDDVGAELAGVPADTRELVIDATAADESAWRAHALVSAQGNVDLLLLPYRSPCALTDPVEARTGGQIGAVDATHVLVAGGAGQAGGVPTSAIVDLAHGAVSALANGLLVPRVDATITASPAGAVVAGGQRPDTGAVQASAEVYQSSLGDFAGAPVALSEARANHAAVTLVSGETLLVGGTSDGTGVLGSLEVVDGVAMRARTAGLGSLVVPRTQPLAARLASGEVLVAGGLDATGAPVTTLEWLASDASGASRKTAQLVASHHAAMVALPAGGALVVVAPDAPTTGFQNTWVVADDGSIAAATPIDGALSAPALFDGPEGEPILWTGDRWLAWQPWSGSFGALAGMATGAPGPAGDPATVAEPGLAIWVDGATVRALRFGTRGPYATELASQPLLAADTSFTAPDRLVTGSSGDPLVFAPSSGLTLQEGATAWLTDSMWASFTLDADVPSGAPPAIVLRDATGAETVLDALACRLPLTVASLHVVRDGEVVTVAANGGPAATCAAGLSAAARVTIGFRGATGGSSVKGVVVAR